jgi:hypothetical protein
MRPYGPVVTVELNVEVIELVPESELVVEAVALTVVV